MEKFIYKAVILVVIITSSLIYKKATAFSIDGKWIFNESLTTQALLKNRTLTNKDKKELFELYSGSSIEFKNGAFKTRVKGHVDSHHYRVVNQDSDSMTIGYLGGGLTQDKDIEIHEVDQGCLYLESVFNGLKLYYCKT
ncbi:hypothetical protein [Algicola sagamiensis]|uniref:hypothetical protein n=1 Tax=Algicola sagamiensis TaxID=163869 RepID=UPI00037815FD|nr:hypothetical protein [Algicola sagamiensis]